jgi:hypothetical protein
MPLQRTVALVTLLVHLLASVAVGLVYLCKMDGQVRLSACCCRSQAQERSPDPSDAIRALGCCDVSQLEANRVPTLSEKRASEPQPAVAVVVPAPAPALPQRPDRGRALSRIDASPPDGPPIYLRTRALLL